MSLKRSLSSELQADTPAGKKPKIEISVADYELQVMGLHRLKMLDACLAMYAVYAKILLPGDRPAHEPVETLILLALSSAVDTKIGLIDTSAPLSIEAAKEFERGLALCADILKAAGHPLNTASDSVQPTAAAATVKDEPKA